MPPAALPTRLELQAALLRARRDLCECEDNGDSDGACLARARCATLLDRWMHTKAQA